MFNHPDHVIDLPLSQRASRRDAMPLRQAAAAAGGGGVLGDEDRMAAHRRLLAVVAWFRGREPLEDELPCVLQDDGAKSSPPDNFAPSRQAGNDGETRYATRPQTNRLHRAFLFKFQRDFDLTSRRERVYQSVEARR